MFNRQSIHIALLLWGCIFSLIAAVCMFMSKNFDRKKRKWILHMLLSTAVLLGSDAIAWGYRGNPDELGYYMVRISNFLVFFFSDVILGLFHGYVCCCLFDKTEVEKNQKVRVQIEAVYIIAVVAALLVILTQFNGLYYTFDAQNVYHRNTWYPLSLILPMLGMLTDCSLIIRYRNDISRHLMVAMLSYIILPFVAAVVLVFYYGISLINIAISISVILLFVEAMIAQERTIARQERKIAEQESILTENRIATMMSQIRPHFIYNTLGSIEQLCELDPEMAGKMVHNFARYLRGNFGELDNTSPIPVAKEIEHCKYYVSIEKIRFPDIDITFDIQTEDFMIPALSVQPLIENAIKHGLMKLATGGRICVSTYETRRDYCIKVEDNGIGFDTSSLQSDRKHIGLRNIRGRLKAMCGGSLRIESKPGKGTRVWIQIPKNEKNSRKEQQKGTAGCMQ